MRTTLFMAQSLNGIIARENGDEDFLSNDHWKTFRSYVQDFGNIIWGRKTYEAVMSWGPHYTLDDLGSIGKIVISSDPSFVASNGFICVHTPSEALTYLIAKGYERALVSGGPQTNTSFIKERLIDEIIVSIEPAVIGKGIQLFSPSDFNCMLSFIEVAQMSSGIVRLRYAVKK